MAVALDHCYLALPGITQPNVVILLGRFPVIFFFLLSGFVLSSNLCHKPSWSYAVRFVIQRLFRLYPPALFSKVLAVLLILLLPTAFVARSEGFMSETLVGWQNEAASVHALSQFFLEATLVHQHLNDVVWTIRVELLCSCTLPIFVFLIMRWSFLHIPLTMLFGISLHFAQPNAYDHVTPLIGYMMPFLMGYWVFRKRAFFEKINEITSLILLFLGIILILLCSFFFSNHFLVNDCLSTGFLFTILVPCNIRYLKTLLETSLLRLMGKLSFSLYLIHFPVLLFISGPLLAHYLTGNRYLDLLDLFIVTISITIACSLLTERWIERSSDAFGKWLAERIKPERWPVLNRTKKSRP